MVTFRKLTTAEELQIIRDIAADIWPETFKNILSAGQIKYMMQMMYAPEVMADELNRGYHFETVCIDGTPIGYISYSAYSIPGTAKLHKVYLLSRYHHQGIGSQMLARAESAARELGFTCLRLNVNKHNSQAIKAYLRNGFKQTEAVKIDIGGGFFMDDFVMEKSL